MKRRLGVLIVGSLTVWAVLVYPAYRLWGDPSAYPLWQDPVFAFSAVAVGLCLLPTTLTLLWAGWASQQTPEQQLLMVLGGTGMRLVFVLGVGAILYLRAPFFQRQSFMVWLLVVYMMTLALEVVLLANRRTAEESADKPPVSSS